MRNANNDNDTWTALGLAAARVLTQIEQPKDQLAGVEQAADRDSSGSENDRERAKNGVIGVILNKKRSA